MNKRLAYLFFALVFFAMIFNASTILVLAHGGEETGFNAENNVKQAIVALDQRQPNMGVIDLKLQEIIDNEAEVSGVDVEKVKEAQGLVMDAKFDEAILLLFEAIGENPKGENPELGSPLLEYEKEFTGGTVIYLLLASGILFILIGGLLIKQAKGVA